MSARQQIKEWLDNGGTLVGPGILKRALDEAEAEIARLQADVESLQAEILDAYDE